MSYLGDFRLGATLDFKFCTTAATTGAPTTLSGTPVISAYPDNSTTQLTAGITLSVDFDSVTGLNNVRVVATSGNGYATATNYELVITTGTVGGTSAVGYVVGSFSIENRSALMPTTATRTLDVASTGEAGVDFDNILMSGTGPFLPFGIVARGTAQAAGATSVTLAAGFSATAANMVGKIIWIYSSTNGLYSNGIITAYDNTTKIATVSGLGEAATGTVLYAVFAAPPGSAVSIATVTGGVTLADGAHGGSSTTLTAKSIAVTNSDAGGVALSLTGSGTGNSHAMSLLSTNGHALALGSINGNALNAASSAADAVSFAGGTNSDGLQIAGNGTGVDIRANITGNLTGNVSGTVAGVTPASATSINATRFAKNTGSQKIFFTLVDSTDHVTRKAGITVTATRSLDGAAFGAATGTVTEVASGVYYLTPSAGDINGDDVVYRFTGTACDPVEIAVSTY